MPSSKEYVEYVLAQLSDAGEVSSRAMMGEYVIYYRGKVIGGIYDDRFLVKPTASARRLLPDAELQLPYEGAKEIASRRCCREPRLDGGIARGNASGTARSQAAQSETTQTTAISQQVRRRPCHTMSVKRSRVPTPAEAAPFWAAGIRKKKKVRSENDS